MVTSVDVGVSEQIKSYSALCTNPYLSRGCLFKALTLQLVRQVTVARVGEGNKAEREILQPIQATLRALHEASILKTQYTACANIPEQC